MRRGRFAAEVRPEVRPAVRLAVRTLLTTSVLTALVLAIPAGASAATGGAGATGHGDEIITSILAARSGGASPSGGNGSTPRCRTHVLGDRQITYLLHVAANMPELLTASFLSAIERYANSTLVATVPTTAAPTTTTTTTVSTTVVSPTAPGATTAAPGVPTAGPVTTTAGPTTTTHDPADPPVVTPRVTYWELTVRICDGVADTMSVRPRTVGSSVLGASAVAGARLRHTTRLPPPVIRMSPPPRLGPFGVVSATIVGEPVFFSATPPGPVRDTVPFGGRTVEVVAVPHHIEVFSGEPASDHFVRSCSGFGTRYDPSSEDSPGEQASDPGACVLVFRQRTGPPHRNVWNGYVALQWVGRFRVDGGPWHPLDGLFSTSVFAISVGEVDTMIGS